MNPWKGLKNLPKNMWILFFATLINRAGTMVLPFLALYMTKNQGISPGEAGFVLSAYGIGALITAPFVGKLADKLGALRIMKISLIATGFVLFLYPLFDNYILILSITLIWSVISEAFRPANMSMIAEVVHPNQRRTAFALNRLAINLGMSIGPVVGGFLSMINFDILFYVDGISSIVAGLFLISAKWKSFDNTEEHEEKSSIKLAALKDFRFIYFLLALIPVQIVFFQHLGALPLYLVKDLGYTEAFFGILASINTILIIFIEVPLTNYLAHWSDKKLLIVGSLLTGIGFGIMAVAGNIFILITSIVIWTFGEMIFFPSSSNFAAEIAPKNRRGEYMGFFQMTFSFAFALGPWLGTEVYEHSGAAILWIGTFIFSIISAFLFFRLKKESVSAN